MEAEKSPYHEVYVRAAGAVAYIVVTNENGDEGIGSCFHIGEGIFVTARHVVENANVREVATTRSARLKDETAGQSVLPRRFEIVDGPHFKSSDLDVAVFRVELGGAAMPSISVSPHTEYDIEEYDLVLSDVVIIGYPPIPFTTIPVQLATLGQINAVVRVRHSPASHFIASTMARGGFSGGVALDRSGVALALVTESLGTDTSLVETGYTSLLSIAPAVDLAVEKYGFSVHGLGPGRYSEMLIGMRFSRPATSSLNSYLYDAHIYVLDDDRDMFIELTCDDDDTLRNAIEAFHAVTPLHEEKRGPGLGWFTPTENPSPATLLAAADRAREILLRAGYVEVAREKSQWQVETRRGSDHAAQGNLDQPSQGSWRDAGRPPDGRGSAINS